MISITEYHTLINLSSFAKLIKSQDLNLTSNLKKLMQTVFESRREFSFFSLFKMLHFIKFRVIERMEIFKGICWLLILSQITLKVVYLDPIKLSNSRELIYNQCYFYYFSKKANR